MNEHRRTEILTAVERWLEDWRDEEPLPQVVAPELVDREGDEPDLASLAAAVIACAKDTQIQSKLLKRVLERLDQNPTYDEAIDDLLDTYDRIERCVQEAQRVTTKTTKWFGTRARVQPIVDALHLVRASLEERLQRAGYERIVSTGRRFDPKCMRAVGQDPANTGEEGLVLTTLRAGFRNGERIVRPAEVRVAR